MNIPHSALPRLSRRHLLKTLIELGALVVTPWGLLPNLTRAGNYQSNRTAPEAMCSAVDAIRYPTDSLSQIHDDFGIYRAGFSGFHTGVDSQFGSYGAPVYAAARGKVTYADPRGWGTERGVVILQHIFPDGSLIYTLYGHMEPINDRLFPAVGSCVELGDPIGSIGGPLYVAPHLHYEVRKMDGLSGGPGYTSVSPLSQGWLHPLDFTERWQLALHPYFRSALTPDQPPVAPPISLSDGSALIAEETQIERLAADNSPLWQLAVADLQGLLLLPDGRLLAVSSTQAYVINNSQFSAVWALPPTVIPTPIGFSSGVTFATIDGRLAAYTMAGDLLWQTSPLGDSIDGAVVSLDRTQLAVSGGQAGSSRLSVIDTHGQIVYQAASPKPIMATPAPDSDGFLIMTGTQIGHLGRDFKWRALMDSTVPIAAGAQIAADVQGNLTVYPGYGTALLAFDQAGHPLWQTTLPPIDLALADVAQRPPRLASGQCAVYMLGSEGTLSAFDRHTGKLLSQAHLYAGGTHGHDAARWLRVIPRTGKVGEQIQFAAGYVSIVTIDTAAFTGLNNCG